MLRYLYTADNNGNVHCRDPTSLAVQHKLSCHSGTLTDFDVCSNLLVTSGLSQHVSQSHRHVRSVQNRLLTNVRFCARMVRVSILPNTYDDQCTFLVCAMSQCLSPIYTLKVMPN